MLGSASSEFIALCQSQVLLLTKALGANSTVVYLAESANDVVNPTLVPLVAYPENAHNWLGLEAALSTLEKPLPAAAQPTLEATERKSAGEGVLEQSARNAWNTDTWNTDTWNKASPPSETGEATPDQGPLVPPPAAVPSPETEQRSPSSQPLILPLAHEGVVLGVMVSTRETPHWNRDDYQQAERVAKTLAIACVMDQRDQWLQNQLRQRQLTQADQSETFHDLLHQFRNPLTALQTFGKLMLKRMQPDDPNQSVAEGIVRESRRLQDLAQNFDDAIAQGDEILAQATTVSAERLLLPAADQSPAAPTVAEEGISPPLAPAGGTGHSVHPLGRHLTLEAGTIAAVAEPLMESAAALAQDREMVLLQDIPPHLPEVWLDAAALREVLSNLLDNAFKYAPKGALIWVAGGLVQHLSGSRYQGIAIGDTGPGIPLQDQEHIFRRHYRGVQAESETPGTGLGLAIVADLVAAMDGQINLISPCPLDEGVPMASPQTRRGPGSLFIVWLKTV
jgi:signal transduction histidine kinase